jgi:MoaA/NifB/PqqE/SkfB family radical SAM enzyme
MNATPNSTADHVDDGSRISVELTNVCNLRCSYCCRDEDMLYNTPAKFFPVELLREILRDARETCGIQTAAFTGGEVTIHPHFEEIVAMITEEGMRFGFVTNGWHFERAWPAIAANRAALTHVSFSIDGPTREAHDRWRGEGSFVRLVRAFARCKAAGLPFILKLGLRRDTLPLLEQTAVFAARMGAASLSFGHNLPTSGAADDELSLGPEDRVAAEQEIAVLARILKMRVTLEVGYRNLDPGPPEERNIYEAMASGKDVRRIPMTLGDALVALGRDEVIRSALPGEMYTVFEHYKRDEWERFCATVTDWDVKEYLDILP